MPSVSTDPTRTAIIHAIDSFLVDYPRADLGPGDRSAIADETEKVLVPMVVTGVDDETMLTAFERELGEAVRSLKMDISSHYVALLASRLVDTVRQAVPAVARPGAMRALAEALEGLFPDDHDAYLTSQNLLRFARTLEERTA